MTEEEAKTKWCPFIQNHGVPSDDSISNRDGMFDNAPTCIGSACMAWRWGKPDSNDGSAELYYDKELRQSFYRWKEGQGRGFCGLAGTP